MRENKKMQSAKDAKNDEFYTQYSDIQKELNAYLEYDADTFRGKTVLLPCDDPEWSNFTRFFAQNFETLGLKKLISTSYAAASKKVQLGQLSLFEEESPQFDPDKTEITMTGESGSVKFCADGKVLEFDEELALKILSEDKVVFLSDMHMGDAAATAWGCDLTYDYVKINGDYRT